MSTKTLISKSKDGRKAMFVIHDVHPITGKKTSVTRHLVYDKQADTFVKYANSTAVSGNLNIQEAV